MKWVLHGARRLDPTAEAETIGDLAIDGDRLADPAGWRPGEAVDIDAGGCLIAPAFIDLHVHLRQPGMEAAETIASGLAAAGVGGFQAVVAMPNTHPPLDEPAAIRFQIEEGRRAGGAALIPSACLTRGRRGEEPTDIEALAAAGAAAFTDDGSTVEDAEVMRRALQRIAAIGGVAFDHAHDRAAERRGVMHEGVVSRRLGLPGIPADAETTVVERDIRLVAETGCRLHVQHASAAGSVELLRQAIARRLPITAEATPHHLLLCDEDLPGADPDFKMNPPLRGRADREALLEAVAEGVIPCLATDHAPHTREAKAQGFLRAPFGVIGLETAIGATWEALVVSGRLRPIDWVRRWTTGPASVLGRPAPSLAIGAPAAVVVIEPDRPWRVDPARFRSLSRNTPFAGWTFHARPVALFLHGHYIDLGLGAPLA